MDLTTGEQTRLELFEQIVMPHLDAAHNLARWLTRDEHNAKDVVQEAYLRAFRFFDGFRGGDGKAWILEVVRNTCRTWQQREGRQSGTPFDEALHAPAEPPAQENAVARQEQSAVLQTCIELLPVEFREVLVLRELEEMSYREIAEATGAAIGTVMSRLARARKRLEECAARRMIGAAR